MTASRHVDTRNRTSNDDKSPGSVDTDVTGQSQILRGLPLNEGFHFYMREDSPLGISAFSLHDFLEKLGTVPAESIAFHLYRGDFEKWVNLLGDDRLEVQLHDLAERNYSGEKLRSQVISSVKLRYDTLSEASVSNRRESRQL